MRGWRGARVCVCTESAGVDGQAALHNRGCRACCLCVCRSACLSVCLEHWLAGRCCMWSWETAGGQAPHDTQPGRMTYQAVAAANDRRCADDAGGLVVQAGSAERVCLSLGAVVKRRVCK
jgi:hypothetical protein